MLKGGGRRAVARRRRPLVIASVIGIAALVAAAESSPPLRFDIAAARRVARRAQWSLRSGGEDASRRVESFIAAAEAVTSRELSAPSWRRDESAVAAAWGRALDEAGRANADLRLRREEAREQWSTVEPEAARAVAEASRLVQTPGLGRREGMLAEQAEVALGRAHRLAAAGDTEGAARAAAQALERARQVADAQLTLQQRFEDRASLRQWQRMVEDTISLSARDGTAALVVDKLQRRLLVYFRGYRVASYPVELGVQGLQQKLHAGDRATPEGRYRVVQVKTGKQTSYYKALLLDYPSAADRVRYEEARRGGRIPRGVGVGSLIEIHGEGGKGRDWTDGCIALANDQMDRLLRFARVRTPVTIVGTVPRGVAR
jgi:L,D-peptidoglycan transpeptidase YkuD (ErfK/YbiS/YcfS/YnhG family)